jgi:hypothetical protein
MKPFVYYKKRERFEKYMAARAAGTSSGLLTSEQAVKGYYEFMKVWSDFTLMQKIRVKQLRQLEYSARARGNEAPVPDYAIIRQDEAKFWEEAFESAKKRTQRGR